MCEISVADLGAAHIDPTPAASLVTSTATIGNGVRLPGWGPGIGHYARAGMCVVDDAAKHEAFLARGRAETQEIRSAYAEDRLDGHRRDYTVERWLAAFAVVLLT
jgi:hypothetical protein